MGDEGEVRQAGGKQLPGGDPGCGGGVVAHGKRRFRPMPRIGAEEDNGHCPEDRRVNRGRSRAAFDHGAKSVPEFGEFGDEFGSWLPVHHLHVRSAALGGLPHAL